ncbi:DUF4269 domain-containing protein [Sphingobacterium sp. WOUb80]|uniref:DUF4269 domain-containing protein n=1 Tax=Sphingobacterium sp. WOUb80 TaxID=3234028 RepID=UPI003CF8B5CB
MTVNFKNIDYLKTGNEVQRKTYRLLHDYQIVDCLKDYDPIVVGTIPIQIDVAGSDVDIILYVQDYDVLERMLCFNFSRHAHFQLQRAESNVILCSFSIEERLFEIYATDKATENQNGYLHMLKEYEIIQLRDEEFAEQVRGLKRSGIKTEPAFCRLLGIEGDPYTELLLYNHIDNSMSYD